MILTDYFRSDHDHIKTDGGIAFHNIVYGTLFKVSLG